jgi:hypothetical protein
MASEEQRLNPLGLPLTGKGAALALGLVFVVALAVMVARQMSAEAMAVVIGIVCGVAAGIPTSVLLLVVMSRRDALRSQRLEELEREATQRRYPPVVVIQGGASPGLPSAPQSGPAVQRQFHVVGGDDLLLDGDSFWKDS